MCKVLAFVIVPILFGGGSLSRRLNAESLYKNLRPAVCIIQAADENGQKLAEGTGFFVKNDLVVTNRHFVDTGRTIAVKTYDNHILVPVKIWIQQVKEDLAILEMDTCGPAQLELAGDEDPLGLEGSHVIVLSNPKVLEETVSDGIISGFRNDPDLIQITATVSSDSSGSPVFNDSGKVIGIVTSSATDGHGSNFAAASTDIRSEVEMVNMSKQAASLCSANRGLPEPPFTLPFGGSPEDVVKIWGPPNQSFSQGGTPDDIRMRFTKGLFSLDTSFWHHKCVLATVEWGDPRALSRTQIFDALVSSTGRCDWKLQNTWLRASDFCDLISEDGQVWARIDPFNCQLFLVTTKYERLTQKD